MSFDRNRQILINLEQKAREREKTLLYADGPLPLTSSEEDLTAVMINLLKADVEVVFTHNASDELIATWVDKEVNITLALTSKPKFDHIIIEPNDLERYFTYIQTKQQGFKPKESQLEEFIADELKNNPNPSLLHLAEKIAINIYTGDDYYYINSFLRTVGKKPSAAFTNLDLADDALQQRIKDILLTTVVATSGLRKASHVKEYTGFRIDEELPDAIIETRANTYFQCKLLHEPAFFSFTDFKHDINFNKQAKAYTLLIENSNGVSVKSYSKHPKENEVLLMPGAQFVTLAYDQQYSAHYFVLAAKRALTITLAPEKPPVKQEPATKSSSYGFFSKKGLVITAVITTAAAMLIKHYKKNP